MNRSNWKSLFHHRKLWELLQSTVNCLKLDVNLFLNIISLIRLGRLLRIVILYVGYDSWGFESIIGSC